MQTYKLTDFICLQTWSP